MKSIFVLFVVQSRLSQGGLNMACVCGFQVIVSDVNQDGLFEILAIDNSGNIACKNLNGKMVSVELLNFPSNDLKL